MLGHVTQVAGDFLDVLFGSATPMMGDVKKDGLRAGALSHESVGCRQHILHRKPLNNSNRASARRRWAFATKPKPYKQMPNGTA
jgi:hypothetical protein